MLPIDRVGAETLQQVSSPDGTSIGVWRSGPRCSASWSPRSTRRASPLRKAATGAAVLRLLRRRRAGRAAAWLRAGRGAVRRLTFTHRVASPDLLWDGVLDGTVRTSALVKGQPIDVQRRIRATFDRLAAEYAVGDGLELPVSVKVATGRRAASEA